MDCGDPFCGCLCHVSPATHVPMCPGCAKPLRPADDDPRLGRCIDGAYCPWGPRTYTYPGRMRSTLTAWVWRPRDNYNAGDLPPHNGFQPLDLTDLEESSS